MKRPVGRPKRVRFPEIPEYYRDPRNLRDPQSRLEYEAIRNGLMEVDRQKEEAK